MFGKTHSKEVRANISSKRKARFADGSLTVWCDGLTKETDERLRVMGENTSNNTERSAKISAALSGVPKSEEHKRKSRIGIKKVWENEELRERQRINILNRFLSKKKNSPSKLEMIFEKMLIESRIKYETQFNLSHRLYDFKVKNTNILVEVDGDFYHTNPNKYTSPICKTQENVMKNDTKKNDIARSSGYTLLRFWESDILNNPQQVITELLTEINKTTPQ
jgi:very-short-patch-repair endonuclease